MAIAGIIPLKELKNSCKACAMHAHCISAGIVNEDALSRFNAHIKRNRNLRKGESLYLAGDGFYSFFIVHSGSVKSYISGEEGEYQIIGFHYPGELLGVDGMNNSQYTYSVEALESTGICELRFEDFETLSASMPKLWNSLFKNISHELLCEHRLMLMLGKLNAEQRLAKFILNTITQRRMRGLSYHELNLSMSRHDIANYLGMAVETVSRSFTRFQNIGLLHVERKRIIVRDIEGLHNILKLEKPEIECALA